MPCQANGLHKVAVHSFGDRGAARRPTPIQKGQYTTMWEMGNQPKESHVIYLPVISCCCTSSACCDAKQQSAPSPEGQIPCLALAGRGASLAAPDECMAQFGSTCAPSEEFHLVQRQGVRKDVRRAPLKDDRANCFLR